MDITYRELKEDEITRGLFQSFVRYQEVTACWRFVNGEWVIQQDPFVDDWTEEEYEFLVQCLKHTLKTNGIVYGAFQEERLKGFASVEGTLIGNKKEYADLTSIHVSKELRGQGIGKELFYLVAQWAKGRGAKKLYISAHSAVESQAFYRSLGCIEAKEYNKEHVASEPCDVQMEYVLNKLQNVH